MTGPAPTWLSPAWFDDARTIWSDAPALNELAGRVQCEIGGGPEGDVSCYWEFDAGRLTSAGAGRIEDPDVTVTVGWDDAEAVQRGELDPSVAFMQGRLKVSGSMGTMTALLARSGTAGWRERQQRVAKLSGF